MENINYVDIKKVKLNPNNPRVIKDAKYIQLLESIREFPKGLELRPLVVNDDMIVLGGNQRLKACRELEMKQVPILKASELTEEEQQRFIIIDNVSFGAWHIEVLKADFGLGKLREYGLDLPNFESLGSDSEDDEKKQVDYSDRNKEVDLGEDSEKIRITLEYTFDDYQFVKTRFAEIGGSPERIIFDLLQTK